MLNEKLNEKMKPVAVAVGTAFVASLAAASFAQADANPFTAQDLASGYDLLADGHEGKCGEGKCGDEGKDGDEGKCGEGKCGEDGKDDSEGKCGEGKCGA